ncbi:MAG: guanine deaminase [Candidatus Melainabacteria bacterium]|nr:guanine deaminase [Candidatus Melainabacteria bacterium]
MQPFLVRGTIVHIISNPFVEQNDEGVLETFEDGALAIDAFGYISAIGPYQEVAKTNSAIPVIDRSGCIILPGLVDCHIHFPQALMIGAYGEQLLDWLQRYTFPEEAKFKSQEYARAAAAIFFKEEIAQGTTTALIFGAHFEQATAIAFEEARKRRFRALMGMTVSDHNILSDLVMAPEQAYVASKQLISNWHHNGKLRYAITPRFAPTCSPAMLAVCQQLMQEHPDIYFQTHLNENREEIKWVHELFPRASSYLDVYDRYGLLGPRSVFAHSVHSSDEEIDRLAETFSRVAHCPSSNSFMGSGLMPLKKHLMKGIIVALGTDIAGGTGYSLLQEMNQAYKVQMLQMFSAQQPHLAVKLSGIRLLYLGTLAGAQALSLDEEIGNLHKGKRADFIVIDPHQDTLIEVRLKNTESMNDKLFVLATVGGKQLIREVFIDGQIAHAKDIDP